MARGAQKAKPRCDSLIIADSVRQERNGKFLLVGVYSSVKLREKPANNSLFVFAVVKSVSKGQHDLAVNVIDMVGQKQMKITGPPFDSTGTNDIGQIIIEITDFEFPSSGPYIFELLIDDKKVAEQVITLEYPNEESTPPVDAANALP